MRIDVEIGDSDAALALHVLVAGVPGPVAELDVADLGQVNAFPLAAGRQRFAVLACELVSQCEDWAGEMLGPEIASGGGSMPDRLPVPGKEFVEPGGGLAGDAGEHVGEPGLRIDVVELDGGDQGADYRSALAAAVGTGEQL